jgi:hypothetical protein
MGEPAREDPLERLRERIRATEEAARRLADEAVAVTGRGPSGDPPPPGGDPPPPPPPPHEPPRTTEEGGDPPGGGDDPPPRGWSVPGAGPPPTLGNELQAIVALLESARALIPPELQQQFAQVLRELLLAIRALIDWYLDRIDRRPRGRAEVEDIPID